MSLSVISARLKEAGIQHVVVSADAGTKIKITTKLDIPKGADQLIYDRREGGNLRDRWSLEDPTKLKLLNAISRDVTRNGIKSFQKEGHTCTIRVHKFGKEFGKTEFAHKWTVALVDPKTRKPVYAQEDINNNQLELVVLSEDKE